jgi:AcrR family transcriptional regulator
MTYLFIEILEITAAKVKHTRSTTTKIAIRDIARKSGITVGNVYRYFKNKESILEGIVYPAYTKIMDFISFSEKMIEEGDNKSFEDFRNVVNSAILQIAEGFRLELLILFKGTTGTRFESTREELIALIENRIYDGLFKKVPVEKKEALFLSRVVARSFLDSLIMVVNESDSNTELETMIYQLNDFYFNHVNERFSTKD